MALPKTDPLDDYLALERDADTKHEFINGEIIAFAGASRHHNLISGNIFAALHGGVRKPECEVYPADMRVHLPGTDFFAYPDVTVVCGAPEFSGHKPDTLTNPALIVEVLSDSTEATDRTHKFTHYTQMPALNDYLMVAQDRRAVEHYQRKNANEWLYTRTTAGSLTVAGVPLALDAIYAQVDFEDETDKSV